MKINKKYLVIRIIAFIPKLFFTLVWFLIIGLIHSLKWLKNGGQELYYGDNHDKGLVKLIEQNEKIIKSFNL